MRLKSGDRGLLPAGCACQSTRSGRRSRRPWPDPVRGSYCGLRPVPGNPPRSPGWWPTAGRVDAFWWCNPGASRPALLAEFVARRGGGKVGGEVGYAVRFDANYGKDTRIVLPDRRGPAAMDARAAAPARSAGRDLRRVPRAAPGFGSHPRAGPRPAGRGPARSAGPRHVGHPRDGRTARLPRAVRGARDRGTPASGRDRAPSAAAAEAKPPREDGERPGVGTGRGGPQGGPARPACGGRPARRGCWSSFQERSRSVAPRSC